MMNYVQTTGLHKLFTDNTFTEFTSEAIALGINSDSIIYIICQDDLVFGKEFKDGETFIWAKGNFYGGPSITDDSLDSTSLNPVQNKVITKQFNDLASFVNTSYGDVLASTEDAKNSAREAYELAQAARIPTLTIPDSTASQELAPNVLYFFETRTSTLTLTLGTPIVGIANEYHFFVVCGSTAPTINFPAGITWNGENAPEIAADKTYEVSILNNIAAYFEV